MFGSQFCLLAQAGAAFTHQDMFAAGPKDQSDNIARCVKQGGVLEFALPIIDNDVGQAS